MTDIGTNILIDSPAKTNVTGVQPGNLGTRGLSINVIQNSGGFPSSFSIDNGVTIIITTTVDSKINSKVRMGAMDFQVVFFQDAIASNKLIPNNLTGYTIQGPFSAPELTGNDTFGHPLGNNGYNLVYRTYLTNNTGSTHTCFVVTEIRFFTAGGAGGVQ